MSSSVPLRVISFAAVVLAAVQVVQCQCKDYKSAETTTCSMLFQRFQSALVGSQLNLYNLRKNFAPASHPAPILVNVSYEISFGHVPKHLCPGVDNDFSLFNTSVTQYLNYGWTSSAFYTFFHPAMLNRMQPQLVFLLLKRLEIFQEDSQDEDYPAYAFTWDGTGPITTVKLSLNIPSLPCTPSYRDVYDTLWDITSLLKVYTEIRTNLTTWKSKDAEYVIDGTLFLNTWSLDKYHSGIAVLIVISLASVLSAIVFFIVIMWVMSERAPRPNTDGFKLWNSLLWVSVGVLAQFVIAVIAVDIHQVKSWCLSPSGCSFAAVCRAIPFFSSIIIVFLFCCCTMPICGCCLCCCTRPIRRCCTRLISRGLSRDSIISRDCLSCCPTPISRCCRSCYTRFTSFCKYVVSVPEHLQNTDLIAKPQSILVLFPLVRLYFLICHYLFGCFSECSECSEGECSNYSACKECLASCLRKFNLLSCLFVIVLFFSIVIVLFYLLPVILLLLVYPVKVAAAYSFLIAALVLYILIAFYGEYQFEASYNEPGRVFYLVIPQLNMLFILAITYLFIVVYIAILSGGPQVSVVHAILSQLPALILSSVIWLFKKWFLKKEKATRTHPETSEPSSDEENTSDSASLQGQLEIVFPQNIAREEGIQLQNMANAPLVSRSSSGRRQFHNYGAAGEIRCTLAKP